MPSEIKVKCRSPHEFLVSIVYSLSYASTVKGPVLRHSLLGLGYIFTALDTPSVYNIPAPDFLLVNTQRKIVVAVECKSGVVENSKLKKKFGKRVIDAIRSALQDSKEEFVIEFVIHTFDIYGNRYAKVAHSISRETDSNILIWTTTAAPQVMAGTSVGGSVEHYTLRKYVSSEYTAKHSDEELDRLLTQGILVREDDIACNPLADPDVGYQILFYEISEYVLRAALSDKYRGRRVRVLDLVQDIKRDYQSTVKIERLMRVVIDVLSIFSWLGEVKVSSYEIVFKKRPRIDIDDFYNVREKIVNMSDDEARRYVAKLKAERAKKRR